MSDGESGPESVSAAENRDYTVQALTQKADELLRLAGSDRARELDENGEPIATVYKDSDRDRPYHATLRKPSDKPGHDNLHSYGWHPRGDASTQVIDQGIWPKPGVVAEDPHFPEPRSGFEPRDYEEIYKIFDRVEAYHQRIKNG